MQVLDDDRAGYWMPSDARRSRYVRYEEHGNLWSSPHEGVQDVDHGSRDC